MEVIEVMSRFAVIERASIDEAYMDLTANVQQRLKDMTAQEIKPDHLKSTYIQGFPQNSENAVLDKGVLKQQISLYCREVMSRITATVY